MTCSGCCRDYLVDYVAGRYAEPYQSAYRSDQVLQLPLKVAQGEGEWDTTGLPQALREYPPTVTAAGWMAQVRALLTAQDAELALRSTHRLSVAIHQVHDLSVCRLCGACGAFRHPCPNSAAGCLVHVQITHTL